MLPFEQNPQSSVGCRFSLRRLERVEAKGKEARQGGDDDDDDDDDDDQN